MRRMRARARRRRRAPRARSIVAGALAPRSAGGIGSAAAQDPVEHATSLLAVRLAPTTGALEVDVLDSAGLLSPPRPPDGTGRADVRADDELGATIVAFRRFEGERAIEWAESALSAGPRSSWR